MAHYSCVNYREAYGMHISCGILFNHEGEFRGHEFVTRKITSTFARISLGRERVIKLGDLTPQRDWGYAGDYVYAMWLMLQQDAPDDYVIATGVTYSVYDFFCKVFSLTNLPGNALYYYSFDTRYKRPAEVDLLVGDSSKARSVLGWKPTVTFDALVEKMYTNDLKIELAQPLF